MPQIDSKFSRPRPAFIVVGAAHLVGLMAPDAFRRRATAWNNSGGPLDGVDVFVVGAGLAS
jgi:hypothetical protein